jgi:hypothetical protein
LPRLLFAKTFGRGKVLKDVNADSFKKVLLLIVIDGFL